jgi:AAA domain
MADSFDADAFRKRCEEADAKRANAGKRKGATADNQRSEPLWRQGMFSAETLQNETLPPLKWIVPNILPAEGVSLLCSKPKFGKSWFVLDLCLGCTSDRFILNSIKPMQGDVLYLALEDSKRRLQRRITKLLPAFGAKWPKRLTIKTEWRRLHEGGLADIRAWHDEAKKNGGNPIMVAVDVLAKVRKPTGNRQLYEADYEALAGLTTLANELNICFLVATHVRKMAADDLMETVSGSFGTTGAVDTILVMANKPSGAVLDIRGRDVESAELAIQFSKTTCRWTVLGTAAEIHVSEQRAKIIAALKDAGEPVNVSALKAATGMRGNALEALLSRMAKAGDIKRVTKGTYAHKDYEPTPPPPARKPNGNLTVLTNGCQDKMRSQHVENDANFSAALQPDAPDRVLLNNGIAAGAETHSEKLCQDSQNVRTDSQATATNEEFPRNGPDRQKSGVSGPAHSDTLPGQRINEVNGLEHSKPLANDGLDIPPDCRRCIHCNGSGGVNEVALPDRPGTIALHPACETAWMEKNR